MWLNRTTPDPFEDSRIDPKFNGEQAKDFRVSTYFDGQIFVLATFPRYGNGTKRRSDFEVMVQWEDVERILDKLCEIEHPEALAIREGRALVAAMKELGWRSPQHPIGGR